MKKTKRYAVGGETDEVGKANVFGPRAPAEDDEMRPGKNLAMEPDRVSKPRPKVAKPTPKGSQSFPISVSPTENAGDAMRRGQAGQRPTQRMTNAPLDKLMGDRKTAAYNAERKANAEERKKTARSTTSEVPYDSVNPNQYKMFEKDSYKKGGSVGSASKRADGCAQRGKTKGRML